MKTINLQDLIPTVSDLRNKQYSKPLTDAMQRFSITTPRQQAAFLANLAHESALFSRTEENLRYSAKRLLQIFPKYFDTRTAKTYEDQPAKIANFVYANRMGNGTPSSGDGWNFRGQALIMLTGRRNYEKFAKDTGINALLYPHLLQEPQYAALASAWFWHINNLNTIAEAGKFDEVCKKINGGYIGYADRLELYNTILPKLI